MAYGDRLRAGNCGQQRGRAVFVVDDWAPWYIAHTDDQRRGRLNIISHLLSQVPYKPLASRDIALPERQHAGGYMEPDLPLRHIPAPF